MAFPSLSKLPSRINPIQIDNTIRNDPEAGKVITRLRYTKELWRFEVSYDLLSSTDVGLLLTATTGHWATVGTWGIFAWTFPDTGHPLSGTTFNVRYEGPIKAPGSARMLTHRPVEFVLLST